ncbi:hypothetical protein V6K52_02225 [Knoellia sp. S7-12]|uniref:hypothetical protein n=1 Tax=Knoellia sp. S7-12 TaxID=3126698 RepID=UPI003368FD05
MAFEITKLEDRVSDHLFDHGEQARGEVTDFLESEMNRLRSLDPADDEAWASEPFDPAEPDQAELYDA